MFNQLCNTTSDINEHLPTLRDLASECEHVTEMGVRYCVSTFAFLEGKPKEIVCIDIVHPSTYVPQEGGKNFDKVLSLAQEYGIKFSFIERSTLDIEIEPTDLLFIDTDHTYEQLKKELELHSDKVRKYIALHDTVSCPEMLPAIDEWLENGVWKVYKHYPNNNGVTVYTRV
jgi:RNAse (barnase) inhibitor barstar